MTGTHDDIRSGDAYAFHEINLKLSQIAYIVLAPLLYPECRAVRANHKSSVTEGEPLALRQQAVKCQPLAFWKMNDIEVVLMLLQPDVGVIRNTGGPSGMNPRLVRHRERNQFHAFLGAVVVNPIDHVSVSGMTSEKEQDTHVVAGPLQRVGQTGVGSTYASIARWSFDFPGGNADPRQTRAAGDINLRQ